MSSATRNMLSMRPITISQSTIPEGYWISWPEAAALGWASRTASWLAARADGEFEADSAMAGNDGRCSGDREKRVRRWKESVIGQKAPAWFAHVERYRA